MGEAEQPACVLWPACSAAAAGCCPLTTTVRLTRPSFHTSLALTLAVQIYPYDWSAWLTIFLAVLLFPLIVFVVEWLALKASAPARRCVCVCTPGRDGGLPGVDLHSRIAVLCVRPPPLR